MIDTAALRAHVDAAGDAPVSYTSRQMRQIIASIERGQAAERQLINARTLINMPVTA